MNSLGVMYDGMPQNGMVKTMKGGSRSDPFYGGWNGGWNDGSTSIGIVSGVPPKRRRARRSMRGGGRVEGFLKGIT